MNVITISGHISYAYNSRTKVMISTKFSGWNHSNIINLAAKDGFKKIVAIETVTNCFWCKSMSWQYERVLDMLITQKIEAWLSRNFSGWKHSTIINLVTENILPEAVALETLTNCFWFKSMSWHGFHSNNFWTTKFCKHVLETCLCAYFLKISSKYCLSFLRYKSK